MPGLQLTSKLIDGRFPDYERVIPDKERCDKIIDFARRELNEGAADRDRTETFSRGQWLKCGDMGLQGLPVPQGLGGSHAVAGRLRGEELGKGVAEQLLLVAQVKIHGASSALVS